MSAWVPVKINPRAMLQPFRPCDPWFIENVCHAACCRSSVDPSGIALVIGAEEIEPWRALGATVSDEGRVAPVERCCPFQSAATHACQLHGQPAKPRGCVISPFTVNKTGTLIVRNRYRLLRCYRAEGAVPVHEAHRGSLVALFGEEQTAILEWHIAAGADEPVWLDAPVALVELLQHKNEASKQPQAAAGEG